MASPFHFKKVRSWLTLWFLLMALLPLTLSTVVIYYQRIDSINEKGVAKLTAIRDFKAFQIENWLDERIVDMEHIAHDFEYSDAITRLHGDTASASDIEYLEKSRHLLQHYLASNKQFDEMFILDAEDGKIVLSTDPTAEGRIKKNDDYFTGPLESRALYIKDIYYSNTLKKPSMAFSIPIYDHTDRSHITGILVARTNLESTVYDLLLDRTSMGKTGETLIVNSEGLALNELRWHQNAPLNLKITATPAKRASQGHTGVIEINDYRNVPVLAAYKHIPRLNWGFVAKQDTAEVYAATQKMLADFIVLLVISIALIVAIAFYLGSKIVEPILKLKDTSEKLREGDFSARNDIVRDDEFGYLADTVNSMADSIQSKARIQQQTTTIIDALVSPDDLNSFAKTLLTTLMETTGARVAAFYVREDTAPTFTPLTAIGAATENLQQFHIDSAEGELGLAITSRRIEHIREIKNTRPFTFKAVAGTIDPEEIITIPLITRGEVKAMISLTSLNGFGDDSIQSLHQSWPTMITSLAKVLESEKTHKMAADLAEKNEELQMNSEELQAQSEELREQADELRNTAAELEAQRHQVETADRLKSEFLSNMSHELRTPLNSVLALSQLMLSRGTGKDPEEEKKFLEVIERNGRQLLNLINDILDLSKIESGRMDLLPTHFSARQMVHRALDTIRPLAEKKGLSIDLQLDTDPQLFTDGDKVNQILLNLLSNAIKFTAQGSLTIRLTADATTASFTITDTGIGIPKNELPHIFDEFRQVDGSVTRKHEGTGLGLAICQKLAVLLGGQIKAESTEGQGSTFTFELALTCPGEEPAEVPKPKGTASLPDPAAPIVLVIDDEQGIRELVANHLTEAGYQVVQAAGGVEGLKLARELKPFAITLDVLMPDLDGWEVLRQLKENSETESIPVIMLSVSDDRETGAALGAAGYLVKPVDKLTLWNELARLTQSDRIQKVLIVDDDPAAREYLQMILEQKGYLTTTATDGRDALQQLSQARPDVVLLDLVMPEMDGFTLLHELKNTPELCTLPVVVLTAKDLSPSEKDRLEQSVRSVLRKSLCNQNELLQEIVTTLERLANERPPVPTDGPPRILVVEDNETAALQIRTALEDSGYRVEHALNGEDAIARVRQQAPNGIVLDLMMPGVDGFQVLEALRSAPSTAAIPVLVLTAKELTAADRARLKTNHVQQLIQKGSVDRAQLISALHTLVHPPAEQPLPLKAETSPDKEPQTTDPSSTTLLIVEDNPDNLLTLTSVLQPLGYRLETATDGRQAIEKAFELRPALILMDMQLPEISGQEATRTIRQDPAMRSTPIIALTANAMKGDREKMLESGCNDYMSKPFDPDKLVELVRHWLENTREGERG